MEEWRDVVGFEGLYEVSNYGRVRSVDRVIIRKDGNRLPLKGKILRQQGKCGNSTIPRMQVFLSKEGHPYSKLVSRIVATAFIPNPENLPEVNHIDEDPSNNHVENLEWCTSQYNHDYGTRNQRQAEKLCKKVNVYDLDGKFIRQYESIKAAAEDIDGDPSSITKVCKKMYKYHKNYIFEYAS